MAFWLGYTQTVEFEIENTSLPPTATFRAQIRTHPCDEQVLGELTTANGTIERLASNVIRLTFPGTMTADWQHRTVVVDVVRTDTNPHQHLDFQAEITFEVPVTREPAP